MRSKWVALRSIRASFCHRPCRIIHLKRLKVKFLDLDQMLVNGLERGTTTVLIGPAGAGKSTIAMQFAMAALRQGHRAAMYSFDEVLRTLFHRAEMLCQTDCREYMAQGNLHVQQIDPAELSPGAFAREVHRVVEEMGVHMVVIDSLNGYMNAMPGERYLLMHLHELFAYLNQNGIVTLVIVAQHGLLDALESPVDTSYLADNVLLLRHFEDSGEVHKTIGIIKKRSGEHDQVLRELRITAKGNRSRRAASTAARRYFRRCPQSGQPGRRE